MCLAFLGRAAAGHGRPDSLGQLGAGAVVLLMVELAVSQRGYSSSHAVGIRGSQDEAEKGAEDADLKGHEDRLLSHGRGLTSHWRITALLFQDYLLKVQNVCSLCEVHV